MRALETILCHVVCILANMKLVGHVVIYRDKVKYSFNKNCRVLRRRAKNWFGLNINEKYLYTVFMIRGGCKKKFFEALDKIGLHLFFETYLEFEIFNIIHTFTISLAIYFRYINNLHMLPI